MSDWIRTLIAFGAASVSAVVIAFLSACIAVVLIVIGSGHTYEPFGNLVAGGESLVQSFLLVGGAAAAAAATLSVLSIAAIAWPSYVVTKYFVQEISVWHCLVGSLFTTSLVGATVLVLQSNYAPLPSFIAYVYEFVSMVVAGFGAAFVFWTVRFKI